MKLRETRLGGHIKLDIFDQNVPPLKLLAIGLADSLSATLSYSMLLICY